MAVARQLSNTRNVFKSGQQIFAFDLVVDSRKVASSNHLQPLFHHLLPEYPYCPYTCVRLTASVHACTLMSMAKRSSTREENRSARQCRIEEATYELLAESGFHACSMLSIAKRAKASNETLYRWYGDKVGLIRSMVNRNAAEVTGLLESQISQGNPGIDTLRKVGPVLLKLLTSERAVVLNRAAATDQTGELGKALSEAGRETVVPLLSQVFEVARENNELFFEDINEIIELYLGLLIGDMQIRRVTRGVAEPKPRWIKQRSELTIDRLCILLST